MKSTNLYIQHVHGAQHAFAMELARACLVNVVRHNRNRANVTPLDNATALARREEQRLAVTMF
jgi:hypothetical protein